MTDTIGAAPETRRLGFWLLLSGAVAAPIFWIGQVMLAYAVTAYACYPGDHPIRPGYSASLFSMLIAFDVIAMVAAVAGGTLSAFNLRRAHAEQGHDRIWEGRTRFLAIWGLLSSLWFFFAILFNTIASLEVPLCAF